MDGLEFHQYNHVWSLGYSPLLDSCRLPHYLICKIMYELMVWIVYHWRTKGHRVNSVLLCSCMYLTDGLLFGNEFLVHPQVHVLKSLRYIITHVNVWLMFLGLSLYQYGLPFNYLSRNANRMGTIEETQTYWIWIGSLGISPHTQVKSSKGYVVCFHYLS